MKVDGKVFVVTGGGGGIGRAVAHGLLDRGAGVAAVDLSETRLAGTVARAPGGGGRLTVHVLDLSNRAAVGELPDTVIEAHGQVDGVVNVAGIAQRFARVPDLSFEEIERMMEVNFWTVVNVSKAFLPVLLQRPWASLVTVASMGALVPVPGQTAYGASKAAVKLFTEGLYGELRGTSVAVTIVFPGNVVTGILDNSGVTLPGRAAQMSSGRSNRTSAASAGEQIIRAIEKGSNRIRIGGDARLLDRLSRLMPRRATALIADKMRFLLDS